MGFDRKNLLLYAVTDRAWTGRQTLYEQIEAGLAGGVTCVQLREKEMADDAFLREAVEVKKLCHRYGVPFFVNDNLTVALESGADGIHVGQEDSPVWEVRKKAGTDFYIGATAKTLEQARRAQDEGADYLGIGAIFPTSTKKNAIRVTAPELKEICAGITIPVVAIGGLALSNLDVLQGCGMDGIAVVSALFAAEDVQAAAAALREKISALVQ